MVGGPGYVPASDLSWREEICALCQHAEGIFVVPFDAQGTAWEIEMLAEQGWMNKSFFVMPATPHAGRLPASDPNYRGGPRDYRARWRAGRARYPELNLPRYDPRGAVVQLGDSVTVFEGFGSRQDLGDFAARERAQAGLEALRSRLAELAAGNDPPGRSSPQRLVVRPLH